MIVEIGTAVRNRRPGVSSPCQAQHREDSRTVSKTQPVTAAAGGSIANDNHGRSIVLERYGHLVRAEVRPPSAKMRGQNRTFDDHAQALGYANRIASAHGWGIVDFVGGADGLGVRDPARHLVGRPVVFVDRERGGFTIAIEPRPWGAPHPKFYAGIDAAMSAAHALSFEYAGDKGGHLEIRARRGEDPANG